MPLVTRTSAQSYVYKQAAAPTSGMATGDVWIDTDNGVISTYSGSAWVQQTAGALGTAGQAIVMNSGGTALEYGTASTIKHVGNTTLSGAADSIEVTGISPTYDIYLVEVLLINSGSLNIGIRFNGDTGTNYAFYGTDSGSAFTGTGQNNMNVGAAGGASPYRLDMVVFNFAAGQSKSITWRGTRGGASNIVASGTWSNTTDLVSQITIFDGDTGQFASGSKMTVKGFNLAS